MAGRLDDGQESLFGPTELPSDGPVRLGCMLDGARTLEPGDQIVVIGFRNVLSTIREVKREHEGRPGVFYRFKRYDPARKRSVWVTHSWLDVIYVVTRGLGSARQETGKAAKAKSRRDAKHKPMSPKPKGRRRDVTAEMDSLFDD